MKENVEFIKRVVGGGSLSERGGNWVLIKIPTKSQVKPKFKQSKDLNK